MLRLFTLALALTVTVGSASAGPVFTLVKPATYTPGDMFTVVVNIEDVNDLASFDLELQLSSTSGVAGTDFGFIELTSVPVTDYVFAADSSAGTSFSQTANTDLANNAFLTISDANDLGLTGVNVGTGAMNSRVLAEAKIFTTALAGNLTLTFGAGTLLLNSDLLNDPTIDLSSATFNGDGPIQGGAAAVPEPTSFVIFGMGVLGMCVRFRRRFTFPASR